ncbi:hypothetical protein PVAND_001416 [Polypedilum vanderplanki]|uniref:Uncharacterized protein n=1 Tax=Polypedilum vanderplanki TaxID=319348 RepID=A0A9J6BNE1_POLVA|nr:hypothetical protein PVAND_001416 [Polypedilum vanderplanki]
MAMTALYPNYDMSQTMSHHHHHHHHHASSMQQSNRSASIQLAAHQQQQSQQSPQTQQQQQPPQKDYSIPLHVDCSVEYELPNQAKPPVGGRVEPLLMIHPCYFRKMESQRRSPFINNMPNSNVVSSTARSSTQSTAAVSSRRIATSQNASQLMTNIHHQPQQQQQQQQQHQNLQQQLDEYVQRQMAHISQQAQFPSIAQHQQQQQQSNSQYSMSMQQQVNGNGNWDRYLNTMPNASMLGKVNIPNQNAYKKSGQKRHLSTATCANNTNSNSYSTTSHIEGALPNGIARWDEKTAIMATIPRDFSESSAAQKRSYCGQQQQQQPSAVQLMSSSIKRERDPMLSGGCIYSNSNNSNSNLTTDINSLVSTGLWPIEKSPMAAIPSSNYHQAGPDSIPIPNNNHSSNSNNTTASNSNKSQRSQTMAAGSNNNNNNNTVIHHSHHFITAAAAAQQQNIHQQQQQHSDKQQQQQQQMINNVNNNNNSNNNSNIITVKCRQYRNSHRMHPYMMNMTAPSVAVAGVSSYFPQLNTPFSQIQQVSCYNV